MQREADTELHSVRGLPECLSGVPANGGTCVWIVYAGPIGAILTPQLQEMHHAQSLPYASSLCGACYEVCPVKIDIPEVLIHLRNKVVKQKGGVERRGAGDENDGADFRSERRFRAAQRLGEWRSRLWPGKTVGSDGCRGSWVAGRRRGTCRRCRRRRFVTGGRSGAKMATEMVTNSARAEVLRRIRAAKGGAASAESARAGWNAVERRYRSGRDAVARGGAGATGGSSAGL